MRRVVSSLLLPMLLACAPPADAPAGIVSLNPEGKTVVINYWAIWCTPCREEIPELNTFVRNKADDVAIYAVNFDGVVGKKLLAQAADLGIQFALLEEDPAQELGYTRPMVLPTTLILSKDGSLLERLLGPQTAADLEQALARHFDS